MSVYPPLATWVYAHKVEEARQKRMHTCRLLHLGTIHCPLLREFPSIGTYGLQNLPPPPRFPSKAYCMAPLITILQSCKRTWFFPALFSQRTFPHFANHHILQRRSKLSQHLQISEQLHRGRAFMNGMGEKKVLV